MYFGVHDRSIRSLTHQQFVLIVWRYSIQVTSQEWYWSLRPQVSEVHEVHEIPGPDVMVVSCFATNTLTPPCENICILIKISLTFLAKGPIANNPALVWIMAWHRKGQWRGVFVFSLICAWTNGWANNRDAGDLRRHCTHHDVIVMYCTLPKGTRREIPESDQRWKLVSSTLSTHQILTHRPDRNVGMMRSYRWHSARNT